VSSRDAGAVDRPFQQRSDPLVTFLAARWTVRVTEVMPVAQPTDTHRVATLLQEAAETHHRVFRITDGVDEDWASWYADWLLDLSELSDLLGARPVRSHPSMRSCNSTRITLPRVRMSRGPRSMPNACTNSLARRRTSDL
jgi:hypothetical protein